MKGLIFTYVMCYGGSVVALFKPWYGLLVYVCFAIIKPNALWYWVVPEGNFSRIVAIALLLGWCMRGAWNWNFGRAGLLVAAVSFAVLWAALLVPTSYDTSKAWGFVDGHLKILLPIIVAMTTIRSVNQVKQLAWVIALSQGYVALELNLSYFGGFNRMQELGFGSLDNNGCAITMNACVGLCFFLGLHAEKLWQKGVAFASALFIAHAVMLSFSRGGLLGLIVTGLVSFWLIPKRPVHYLAFAIAVAIGLRLAGAQVLERFGTAFVDERERDRSASLRLLHWDACTKSMLKNPWGVGPFQWPHTAMEYGLPEMEAHSFWFQTGAELGVPGLLAFVLFYLGSIWRLWPLARGKLSVADPWLVNLAQMVIASLVGFCVSTQFVSSQGVETPFYVALVGMGTLKLYSLQSAALPVRWQRTTSWAPATRPA